MELDDFLKDLDAKSNFPAKEYPHIEGESDLYPNMDDESILNSVQNNVEDDEDINETIIEPITLCQGKLALETLKTFIFQKNERNQHDINCLEHFTAKFREWKRINKQKTLDKWLNVFN